MQASQRAAGWSAAGVLAAGGLVRDAVAHSGRGRDDGRIPELAPQPADGDGDGVGEWVGVLVPYLLQQVLGAEEAGPGPEQRLEYPEFLGRQVKLPPVTGDRAPQRIELDPGRAQDPGPRGGLAPGEGADAQDELGEVEWLGQGGVGAQAPAGDPGCRPPR